MPIVKFYSTLYWTFVVLSTGEMPPVPRAQQLCRDGSSAQVRVNSKTLSFCLGQTARGELKQSPLVTERFGSVVQLTDGRQWMILAFGLDGDEAVHNAAQLLTEVLDESDVQKSIDSEMTGYGPVTSWKDCQATLVDVPMRGC